MKNFYYSEQDGYRVKEIAHLVLANKGILGTAVDPSDAAIIGAHWCSKYLDDGSAISWFDYRKCPSKNGFLLGTIGAKVLNLKTGRKSQMLPRDAIYKLQNDQLILIDVAFSNTHDCSSFMRPVHE